MPHSLRHLPRCKRNFAIWTVKQLCFRSFNSVKIWHTLWDWTLPKYKLNLNQFSKVCHPKALWHVSYIYFHLPSHFWWSWNSNPDLKIKKVRVLFLGRNDQSKQPPWNDPQRAQLGVAGIIFHAAYLYKTASRTHIKQKAKRNKEP